MIYRSRIGFRTVLNAVALAVGCAAAFVGCSGGSQALPAASTSQFSPQARSQPRLPSMLSDVSTTITEMPTAADDFVDSAGINTHFVYFSTPYVTAYSHVRDLLVALGVRHIRDSLDDHGSGTYVANLKSLAASGIRTNAGTVITDTPSSIRASLAEMGNVVEAVEGLNEYDLYGGSNWVAQDRSFQRMVYTAVKSAPNGASIPVYGPSITPYGDAVSLGDLSSSLDAGSMHDYFGSYNPGTLGGAAFPVGHYNSLQFWTGMNHIISRSKRLVTTETGYEDQASTHDAVSPSVKARYLMRELLLHWNAKVGRTYFYELVDEGGQSLGFLDANLHAKPVYTAMQNLLHNLSDPGSPAVLKPLTYTLTGDASVAHTLLQKRDGSYRFMSWLEVPQRDPTTPTQTVTIRTTSRFRMVVQYACKDDGSFSTTGLTQKADGSITFQLTDRVSEIKLQP